MQLGEPVDGLVEQPGSVVRLVVTLVALAIETEVRRQVDDLEAALPKRFDGRCGGAVRVRDERRIGPLGKPSAWKVSSSSSTRWRG